MFTIGLEISLAKIKQMKVEVFGNALLTMPDLNLQEALIVTLDNVEKKRLVCEVLQQFSRDVRIVIKVVSLREKEALEALEIGAVIDTKKEIAHILADEAKLCRL
jgi:CPA2 family monovalent cation:H+ antiporter-2